MSFNEKCDGNVRRLVLGRDCGDIKRDYMLFVEAVGVVSYFQETWTQLWIVCLASSH